MPTSAEKGGQNLAGRGAEGDGLEGCHPCATEPIREFATIFESIWYSKCEHIAEARQLRVAASSVNWAFRVN